MKTSKWLIETDTGDSVLLHDNEVIRRIPAGLIERSKRQTEPKPNYIDQLKSHLSKHYANQHSVVKH